MEAINQGTKHYVNVFGRPLYTTDGVHYVQDRETPNKSLEMAEQNACAFFDKMDSLYAETAALTVKAVALTVALVGLDVYNSDIQPILTKCCRMYGNNEATVACLRVFIGLSRNGEEILHGKFPDELIDAAKILAHKCDHSCEYLQAVKSNELARRVRIIELLFRIHQRPIYDEVDEMTVIGSAKEVAELIHWEE